MNYLNQDFASYCSLRMSSHNSANKNSGSNSNNSASPRYAYASSLTSRLSLQHSSSSGSSSSSSSSGTSPDLQRNSSRSPEEVVHDVLSSALDCPVEIGSAGSDFSQSPPSSGLLCNSGLAMAYLNGFSDSETEMCDYVARNFDRHHRNSNHAIDNNNDSNGSNSSCKNNNNNVVINNNNNNNDNSLNSKNHDCSSSSSNNNHNNSFLGLGLIGQQGQQPSLLQGQQSRSSSSFSQIIGSSPQRSAREPWSYESPPRLPSPDEVAQLNRIWGSPQQQQQQQQLSEPVLSRQLNELIQMQIPRCEAHQTDHGYFCQTCDQTICSQCIFEIHSAHQVTHLMAAIDKSSNQSQEIINTIKNTKNFIMDRETSIQESINLLDVKKLEAKTAVKSWFRWYVGIVQAREQELVNKIENAFRLKHQSLKSHSKTLKGYMTRLQNVTSELYTAINAATITTNPVALIKKKDDALAQLYQVRQSLLSHPENEEGWIVFNPPNENQTFRQVENLGAVVTVSPGTVGDRRSRPNTNMLSLIRQAAPVEPRATGVAVPGLPRPVVLSIPTDQVDPVMEIGNRGSSESELLCRPWGVACDAEGRIVVADRSNNRIMLFGKSGNLIRQFGSLGSAPGQFDRPAGIAVDAFKRIIVADKDNHRIQVMTMEGKHIHMFGQKGNLCGQFNYPWDVAVNSECHILVSDTRNHRIQQFCAAGVFLRKFGFEMSPQMLKSFDSPRGVAFDPAGNVVLTDFNTHRVVLVDSEFSSFSYLGDSGSGASANGAPAVAGCGRSSADKPQFQRPQGVVLDDAGNYIVADSKNCQIQIFNREGQLVRRLGTSGNPIGKMDRPSGMAITPDGRLAIVDFGNNRVVIF